MTPEDFYRQDKQWRDWKLFDQRVEREAEQAAEADRFRQEYFEAHGDLP